MLRGILGEDTAEEIKKIEKQIFDMAAKPKVFAGASAVHIRAFHNYNETCSIMRQNNLGEPKRMTVVEYFQSIDILKKLKKPKR